MEFQQQHHNAFSVAKAMPAKRLEAITKCLNEALQGGQSFSQFKAGFPA